MPPKIKHANEPAFLLAYYPCVHWGVEAWLWAFASYACMFGIRPCAARFWEVRTIFCRQPLSRNEASKEKLNSDWNSLNFRPMEACSSCKVHLRVFPTLPAPLRKALCLWCPGFCLGFPLRWDKWWQFSKFDCKNAGVLWCCPNDAGVIACLQFKEQEEPRISVHGGGKEIPGKGRHNFSTQA